MSKARNLADLLDASGDVQASSLDNVFPNGTQENPFFDLADLKTASEKGIVTTDGDYYFLVNDVAVACPVKFFHLETSNLGKSAAFVKLTPDTTTAIKDNTVTSLSFSSSGVITMSNIVDNGCGTLTGTYLLQTPWGYSTALANIRRVGSIHQCMNVRPSFTVTGQSGNSASLEVNESIAAGTPQFLAGSYTGFNHETFDRYGTTGYTDNDIQMCAWSNDIFAFKTADGTTTGTQQSASNTSYNYQYLTMVFDCTYSSQLGVSFNCSSETSIDQTGTTHEWWVQA